MSWHEAMEDGVPVIKDSTNYNRYYPPCRICGAPVNNWSYIRGVQYTCKDCRTELVRQTREEGNAVDTDKKQKKLEVAVKRISKVVDIAPYDDAIRLVKQNIYKVILLTMRTNIWQAKVFVSYLLLGSFLTQSQNLIQRNYLHKC